MKRLIICLIILVINSVALAQHINGQWRGYFNSNGDIVLSSGDNTEYVLDIDIKGTKITGFSYSYFQDRKYYVICSLLGTYNKTNKRIIVTEITKVKGFTPPLWKDCLQTHMLTYEKKNGMEDLKGSWKTAPGQTGNCGSGVTTLIRRTLSKDLSTFNKANKNNPFSAPVKKEIPEVVDKAKNTTPPPPVAKKATDTKIKTPTTDLPLKKLPPPVAPIVKSMPQKIVPEINKKPEILPVFTFGNFEKRGSEILKTIEITGDNFKVDLYDNGVVDGDSISLFYNGKLILPHKMLSEKPITLTLDATDNKFTVNELIMYADNLGLYPPNTALMVVTDGDKRYEIRISSDLKKSGTIRFIHKSKKE